MDRHEHHVIIAIDELDDLLRTVSVGHAHQSRKTPHAMVYVHHVVARFKLREFLERDGHLATARLVATQVILMEAVEDLMVSEAGHPHRSIGKSSMNGPIHRLKGYVIATLLEDGLQALGLLGAIGEDIELIPTPDEVGKRLLHQFEVLMEQRLGRCLEGHRSLHRSAGLGTKLNATERLGLADEVGRSQ